VPVIKTPEDWLRTQNLRKTKDFMSHCRNTGRHRDRQKAAVLVCIKQDAVFPWFCRCHSPAITALVQIAFIAHPTIRVQQPKRSRHPRFRKPFESY
jgi:hypothetical protein